VMRSESAESEDTVQSEKQRLNMIISAAEKNMQADYTVSNYSSDGAATPALSSVIDSLPQSPRQQLVKEGGAGGGVGREGDGREELVTDGREELGTRPFLRPVHNREALAADDFEGVLCVCGCSCVVFVCVDCGCGNQCQCLCMCACAGART